MERLQQAIEDHRTGRWTEAEEGYRQFLSGSPNHPQGLWMLGVLYTQSGRFDHAIPLLKQSVQLAPRILETHRGLISLLAQAGRNEEAILACRHGLQYFPESVDLWCALADLLRLEGKHREAIESYQQVLGRAPDSAEAWNNLGLACQATGNLQRAGETFQQAIAKNPRCVEALTNLGNLLQEQGDWTSALRLYDLALAIAPHHAPTHGNRGSVLKELGRMAEAVDAYAQAIALAPDPSLAHFNLGRLYDSLGELRKAHDCYQRAFEVQPHSPAIAVALVHARQHLCRWEGIEALSRTALQLALTDRPAAAHHLASPFSVLCLPVPTTPQQQLEIATRWSAQWRGIGESIAAPRSPQTPCSPRHSPLRIGYLSADFHQHATAWLIAETIENHVRPDFEVFGYSYGPNDHDPMRQRLIAGFDHFRDLRSMSHRAAAQIIADDAIDILVDLKGYTLDARPSILAFRPAPIQVNYLGYPGTMGAEFIDYILVDSYVVPIEHQAFYTERIVQLPGCYQANDRGSDNPSASPTRRECGLDEEAIVCCSFNQAYKYAPPLFEVWMRILAKQSRAVLWLLESNSEMAGPLRARAQQWGIDPARLVFAPHLPRDQHLARLPLADLFLDSFPVNAHTTASDALRMGVPLLTLSGDTFISRVAGSLLRELGLSQLIAKSADEYESIGTELVQDPSLLLKIRTQLAQRRQSATLFDGVSFARKLERAFRKMWQIRQQGHSPRTIPAEELT